MRHWSGLELGVDWPDSPSRASSPRIALLKRDPTATTTALILPEIQVFRQSHDDIQPDQPVTGGNEAAKPSCVALRYRHSGNSSADAGHVQAIEIDMRHLALQLALKLRRVCRIPHKT